MEIDSGPPSPSPPPKAAAATGSHSDGDDADPIIASYDVYTNAPLPENRKLLILQHPNRQGPVRTTYPQLSEVRLKNKTGMLEVDVPMGHAHADYDRDKGLRWGGALARSVSTKSGGSLGLAGGFGVGVPAMRGAPGAAAGRGRRDDLERELGMLDWSEAVRQDKVLRTQTLGGQFPAETETNCRWMVGVFTGNQLHLTPATSLIHLRPQLHHLDAYAEQERLSRPREGPAAGGVTSGGGAGKDGAAGSSSGAGPGAARAIHMSIKSAGADSGELTVDTMSSRLRQVQTEPWMKLKYEDDESSRAWSMFSGNLIYAGAKIEEKEEDSSSNSKSKGKGKEKSDSDDASRGGYKTQWSEDEFLRAVSGLTDNQEGDAKTEGDDVLEIKAEEAVQTSAAPVRRTAGAARGKGRATAGTVGAGASTAATATSSKRGARGRSVAFKE
ncbi:hypothetical protein AAE478_000608 [Parahypoxylon ruwenzoriense]